MKIKLVATALFLMSSFAFAGSQVKAPANVTQANWLYVQSSEKGSLTAIPKQPGFYNLELTNVHPYVTAFSDRPVRHARTFSLNQFMADWTVRGNNFMKDAPNADISMVKLKGKQLQPLNYAMELVGKSYTPKTNTLTYKVRMLSDAKSVPQYVTFDTAALFIDGCCCVGNDCG